MDTLLEHVSQLHGPAWDNVLDAGTGRQSLQWLCSLKCKAWTAVTAEAGRADVLRRDLGRLFRPQDRLLVGRWSSPELLSGERFETVIADYLLGSVERYDPHFQGELLERLADLTAHRLYLTGLEPFQGPSLPQDIANFRDACHLLCERVSHREIPHEWVLRQLRKLKVKVLDVVKFENFYDEEYFQAELRGVTQILGRQPASPLRQALLEHAHSLRVKALHHIEQEGPICCSFDYLIAAEKT